MGLNEESKGLKEVSIGHRQMITKNGNARGLSHVQQNLLKYIYSEVISATDVFAVEEDRGR